MRVELTKTFNFEAAHSNPNGDPSRKRLHGHGYRLEVAAAGEVTGPVGWLIDYGDIRQAVAPFRNQLDHALLNDVEGMRDFTLPGVRRWLLERIAPVLPCLSDIRLTIRGDCAFRPVTLAECPATGLPGRVRFSFEAAQQLPQLPEGHPCRRLHGHSYFIEIALREGDALDAAAKLYDTLDHRCLNDLDGLDEATSEHLCEWLWGWLETRGFTPHTIVVQETESARCIHRGE